MDLVISDLSCELTQEAEPTETVLAEKSYSDIWSNIKPRPAYCLSYNASDKFAYKLKLQRIKKGLVNIKILLTSGGRLTGGYLSGMFLIDELKGNKASFSASGKLTIQIKKDISK